MKKLIVSLFMLSGVAVFSQQPPKIELIELPYTTDALEPVISQKTVELHHGKHLKGYVDNLNKLITGTKYQSMPLENIVCESEGAIFNNAGQVLNHNLYFTQLSRTGKPLSEGPLRTAIEKKWGTFDNFKDEFSKSAVSQFGSGWVWLAKDMNGQLQIVKENNAGNPVTKGLTPIMGFDVWEHAYYLDYNNRRSEHIDKIWGIIDWDIVAERY